ncbi:MULTISPECIES: hypothetical protein [Achromobacter]|nr:hypothetical protein [Achromobacter sp. ACM05]MBV7499818.1 hypothetical protein [Achromobacter sp. ACM05]
MPDELSNGLLVHGSWENADNDSINLEIEQKSSLKMSKMSASGMGGTA